MLKPVYYSQKDPRWKDIPYTATGNPRQTIGSSACGPTCAAMVIAELRDEKITPVETSAWSVAHNYRTIGTEHAYFVPQLAEYGIPCEYTWWLDKAVAALKQGRMVIGLAHKGLWTSEGHYILAYGLSADCKIIYINDPNSLAVAKSQADFSKWEQEVLPYWIIKEEHDLSGEEIAKRLAAYQNSLKAATYPEAVEASKNTITTGIFKDGDGDGFIDRPKSFVTREELSLVANRIMEKIK